MSDAPDSKPKRSGAALPWLLFFLVLAGAGVAGYFGHEMLQAEQERTAAATKASEDAATRIKALEAEKASLEAGKKELEERVHQLEGEKGALEGEVKDKQAELDKLKATYDSLEDKMKEEIKKGEIRLSQSGNRIQVDMVDKVLFDSGQAELSQRGADVLDRVGAVLANIEDKAIQVSGHTDDAVPSKQLSEKYPTNWELSSARAVNVVRYLVEHARVPARRLVAAGYGQYHPIATNANPEGRAHNRRIEILLTPALDAKPTQAASAAKGPPAKPAVPPQAGTTKAAPARAVAPAKAVPAKGVPQKAGAVPAKAKSGKR